MTAFVDANGNESSVRTRLDETIKDRLLTRAGRRPLYPAGYGSSIRRFLASPRHDAQARSDILAALRGASALTIAAIDIRYGPGRTATVHLTATSPLAPNGYTGEVSA